MFNKPYLFVEFVIVIHKSNVTKKFNVEAVTKEIDLLQVEQKYDQLEINADQFTYDKENTRIYATGNVEIIDDEFTAFLILSNKNNIIGFPPNSIKTFPGNLFELNLA